MSKTFAELGKWLDEQTGYEGSLGVIAILILAIAGHAWINSSSKDASEPVKIKSKEEQEEDEDPPRNFTSAQLLYFNGTKDEKTDENRPVYLSLAGIVFDVSDGRDFYGPGGPYEMFAGRECGAALAKMSFDDKYLDNVAACKELNPGEKFELENWMEKFKHYRCYPVRGRLVPDDQLPPPTRVLTKEDLAENDGSQDVPEGYGAAPIYIGAGTKVFDMSFGGMLFYGKGCTYNIFAGKDASRALAKMSFEKAIVDNPNTDDLSEKELKIMNDWITTFEVRKTYPIVGTLKK
eukprot:CAMPEP_0118704608 /NCGR_PEP_ID=MMETSP0800-20121206/19338_1 /TAXON_ID=210618 ORGANISM="Striatella unipunctata, Strain CCMP2910" /NCGR_SAMPLE_ID=MMETSP0800 /ASSEMBLY_ACC=CAM_ASM_000638 /LENGTH=291 /DNA_ID=CAMNT_0006606533 /DNA_START=21 /DNA_END=896 /DNA_ORIENTATION=-